MANIQLENLDNSPISFDLSTEDLDAIKGGITFPVIWWPFPIRIYIIKIAPAPITPE